MIKFYQKFSDVKIVATLSQQLSWSHLKVELFKLEQDGIHIAEFITQLPSLEIFEHKLHKAALQAKAKVEGFISWETTDA